MTELADFCKRVCAITDDPNASMYLRLRTGRARKSAETIASGIECTGVQAFAMERILLERIQSAGGDDPVWIEAIAHGSSQIRDSIKIAADEPIDPDARPLDMAGVVSTLTEAVLALALRAEERADRASQNNMESTGAFLRTFQEYAMLKGELASADQGGDYAQALAMFAPLMPVLAAKLSPEKQLAPTNVDEHADRLVGAIRDLADNHPEAITPDRLAALAPLLNIGLR